MATQERLYPTGRANEQQLTNADRHPSPRTPPEADVPDYSEWTFDRNYEYRLYGYENQALEVNLPPGHSIQTDKGAMAWRHETVRMNTGLGANTGLLGALRRRWSGESLLVNTYTNEGGRAAVVGITPTLPSHIVGVPMDHGRSALIMKKGSYLASTPGMEISIAVNRKISVSVMSRNFNLVMQRVSGAGTVFITSNGIMLEKHLRHDDSLLVQIGNLVAFENTVVYEIAMNRGLKNVAAGGEGIFMMKVSGPGKVWIQTTPRRDEAKALIEALKS